MRQGRVDLVVAASFCGALGLYDTLYVLFLFTGGPLIGSTISVLFADFLVFHAAAVAWLQGKTALIYNIDAFTSLQNLLYVDRFGGDKTFRPFLYPPIWLLMLLPFGWFAVGKAFALFMAVTASLATALEGWRDKWGWLAVLTSPAAVWTVIAGQNTFLSVALFYGGWRLLDRAPAAAGILLGLLAYKPQIWMLVPLALLAARQWKALAWMVATVALLSLASLGLFGLDFWRAFFAAAREASSHAFADEMFRRMFMHMTTLVAAGRLLGLPTGIANAIQLVGSLLAVAAVWLAFRRYGHRDGSGDARTAVLAAATFLVSPYTLNYDLLLLMPATVALFRRGARQGFYPAERLVHLALWLMPTFGMVLNHLDTPIMPAVILLFGAIAWARLRDASKGELPEAAAAR
jgi:alpha-1,2-mannosyltransferase